MLSVYLFAALSPVAVLPLFLHACWRVALPDRAGLRGRAILPAMPFSLLWVLFWPLLVVTTICSVRMLLGFPTRIGWTTVWGLHLSGLLVVIWLLGSRCVALRRKYFKFVFKRESGSEISFHVKLTRRGRRLSGKERVMRCLSEASTILAAAREQIPPAVDMLTLASPWFGTAGRGRNRYLLTQMQNMLESVFPGHEIVPVERRLGPFETLLILRFGITASTWRKRLGMHERSQRLMLGGFAVRFKPIRPCASRIPAR